MRFRADTGGRRALTVSSLAGTVLLAGCASFSKDGGFDSVQSTVREKTGVEIRQVNTPEQAQLVANRVGDLLAKPLGIDDAVQLALLNNPGLRASYAELGLAEADLVQAGRLPNPRFAMLRARNGDEFKIEQAFTLNVFALLTMPQAQAIERRRFERTQRAVALDVLRLASDTRKAWVQAVAAGQTVQYLRQVREAAESGAELARRMAQVGNFNRLQHAREQSFYADAALSLARAEQAHTASRERLTRLLGLWGAQTRFVLPDRLPELPRQPEDMPDVERRAIAGRLDIEAARLDVLGTAQSLGLTRTTRFINALELGPARVLEGTRSEPYKRGFEVSFELPLFDWGSSRVVKAEAIYMQAVARAAETAVNARSEVREAYAGYRSSWDIARHLQSEIVPLRKRISEENQLRYNGMLIGVFELLADARAQINAVNAGIDAQRDFWLARADLDMALIGKPELGASAMPAAAADEQPGH